MERLSDSLVTEPLVSVVIPCYNAERKIGRAIQSLILQTYLNWEAIIVNDGSTDSTEQVILKFGDSRLKYFSFENNKGRGAARQKGLEEGSGKYLAMLDADDWIYPDKLEKQVIYLESHEDVSLVSGNLGQIDSNNKLISKRKFAGLESGRIYHDAHYTFPPIPHASSMMRMDIAKQYAYDTSMTYSEDSDFLIKVLAGRKYSYIDEINYIYSEYDSNDKTKIYNSNKYSIIIGLKYFSKNYGYWLKTLPFLIVKRIALIFLLPFINTDYIVKKRNVKVTNEEKDVYKVHFNELIKT